MSEKEKNAKVSRRYTKRIQTFYLALNSFGLCFASETACVLLRLHYYEWHINNSRATRTIISVRQSKLLVRQCITVPASISIIYLDPVLSSHATKRSARNAVGIVILVSKEKLRKQKDFSPCNPYGLGVFPVFPNSCTKKCYA